MSTRLQLVEIGAVALSAALQLFSENTFTRDKSGQCLRPHRHETLLGYDLNINHITLGIISS
jgi:hypothetical protein